jgi:hypothetical protein
MAIDVDAVDRVDLKAVHLLNDWGWRPEVTHRPSNAANARIAAAAS